MPIIAPPSLRKMLLGKLVQKLYSNPPAEPMPANRVIRPPSYECIVGISIPLPAGGPCVFLLKKILSLKYRSISGIGLTGVSFCPPRCGVSGNIGQADGSARVFRSCTKSHIGDASRTCSFRHARHLMIPGKHLRASIWSCSCYCTPPFTVRL